VGVVLLLLLLCDVEDLCCCLFLEPCQWLGDLSSTAAAGSLF
jgi:hypothetical protein